MSSICREFHSPGMPTPNFIIGSGYRVSVYRARKFAIFLFVHLIMSSFSQPSHSEMKIHLPVGQSNFNEAFPLANEQCEFPRVGIQRLFGSPEDNDRYVSTSLPAQHVGHTFLGNRHWSFVNRTM